MMSDLFTNREWYLIEDAVKSNRHHSEEYYELYEKLKDVDYSEN